MPVAAVGFANSTGIWAIWCKQGEEHAVTCTLAFDIYGTLFDTDGVHHALLPICAELGRQQVSASDVMAMWRDKQLEYSFRRGLMQRFKDFSVCTRDALRYCDAYFKLDMSAQQEASLLDAFNHLPAYSDVAETLTALSKKHRIYAFSNGCQPTVEGLLEHAGLSGLFNGVVSVTETKTFKPDPAVYTHFLRQTDSDPEQTWLVSANSFDIIGADSVGMRTAWIRRSAQQHFDPWGVQPELTVANIGQLINRI